MGTINAGTTYTVLGRYMSWIEFEYASSPTGKGWVYGELVNLTGNTDNIPDVDPYVADQQLSGAVLAATSTQSVLTLTPGGVLTATAIAQQGALSGGATATSAGTPGILPTFTYPPGIVALPPTASAADAATPGSEGLVPQASSSGDSLPPIAPILALGGVGLLGLILNSLRRR